MTDWVWPDREVIVAVHEMQLAEHGGLAGVRDAGLLDSALSRAPNLAAYESPDTAALAAAYGWGISRNHPFIDGNKRTGFVAAELFLNLNGHELQATDADCVLTMLGVAAGEVSEEAFAAWLRGHIVARAKA
jgi:death-on-curing protein